MNILLVLGILLTLSAAVSLYMRVRRIEKVLGDILTKVSYLTRLKEAEESKRIQDEARLFMGKKSYEQHFGTDGHE